MNLEEYEKVKDYTYLEYCDYLQNKYGIGLCDYMTKLWTKNRKVTRTKEGLLAHHKFEDHAIKLSSPEYAKRNPFEWQSAENIVYCDYLEHLFLHILICEFPADNHNLNESVGGGGIFEYLIPQLNDFYSGWKPNKEWEQNCYNLIKNDKAVYLALVKRFKEFYEDNPAFKIEFLLYSYNEQFGLWSKTLNQEIFEEIKKL